MASGTLVGALCQDTTTTTGTGAITLANAVPAGAPAGSTTFATQFAPNAVFQTAPGNTFYAISDGSNIEVGLGTLTSATNLTRDYVLGAYTGGVISLATQTASGTHINFAAGTKNVYSNPTLFASSVAYWNRIPDDNAANIFNAIMSGTFTSTLANTGTVAITVRYKVTNEGMVVITIPAATVVNNAATGPVTITAVPAFLCNALNNSFSSVGAVTFNGAQQVGCLQVNAGATPTSTGTFTLFGQVAAALTSTVTTATNNGFPAGASFAYPLF